MTLIQTLDALAEALAEQAWPAPVVTLGTFDGVHAGHRSLLAAVVDRARAIDGTAVVITFRPHPVSVLAPDKAPPLLSAYEDKHALLESVGVDQCVEVPFDDALREWSPERVVTDIIASPIGAVHVVAGPDLRFGKKAAGDATLLRTLGSEYGFTVSEAAPYEEDGAVVSSTRIRRLVADGKVEAAAALLRRPHRLRGEVVHGHARGAGLGFPTANLRCEVGTIPADGIYACRALLENGETRAAAVSVGTAPTFGENQRAVEAFLLDFSGDLYGQVLVLDFIAFLRGEERYTSVEALVAQIERDVAETRRLVTP